MLTANSNPSSPPEAALVRIAYSHLLSGFITETVMEVALFSGGNSDIDICSDRTLSDLEYAVDFV